MAYRRNITGSSLPREIRNIDILFDTLPGCVAILDPDYKILAINDSYRTLFGGRKYTRCHKVLTGKEQKCDPCPVQKTIEDGKPHTNRINLKLANGKPGDLIIQANPIKDGRGRTVAVMEHVIPVPPRDEKLSEPGIIDEEHKILFDLIPCYISVQDRYLRIIKTNELFVKDFGEAEGKYCYEVYKRRDTACPDCAVMKTFEDGKERYSEEMVITKHGSKANVVVNRAPIKNFKGDIVAVMEVFTNITDVMKLQKELKTREEEFRNLFNIVPCYISVQNRDFEIVNTNQQFIEDFGNRVGEKCFKVYKGRDKLCPNCQVQETFQDGLVHSSEEIVITKDGRTASMVVYTSPIKNHTGEIVAVMEMSTNITEIKQLQKELIMMGLTIAGMAHRIKNILMGLEGGIYVVNSGLAQKDESLMMEGWDMVQRNVEMVSEIVKDLLFCSKEREPDFKKTDPNSVALKVYDLFREKMEKDGIKFTHKLNPRIPPIYLDQMGLHSLLTNLISNAYDACRFCYADRTFKISMESGMEKKNGVIYFKVKDNGKGIPRKKQDRMFTEFFSTKGREGTGLGLMVIQKVIQQHGGKISFTSQAGRGTTFTATIPTNLKPKD